MRIRKHIRFTDTISLDQTDIEKAIKQAYGAETVQLFCDEETEIITAVASRVCDEETEIITAVASRVTAVQEDQSYD